MFLCYSYNSSNWWASATTLTTKCILQPIPLLLFIVSSRWSILNVTLCTLHDFFLCVIWWTWTLHFSVIEHASMHLCLLYMLALPGTAWLWRLVYTFTHSHIQTLNDESQPSLPPDFHSTIGCKRWRAGQSCRNHHNCFSCWSVTHCTQWVHMGHYVEWQNEVNQCPQGEDLHPDTQSHTGMLVRSISQ